MRILGCFVMLVLWVLIIPKVVAQVTFYSNPEPVHGLNSADAENYLYLSEDGSELIFTREKSVANVGGKGNPGDLWFAILAHQSLIDSAKVKTFNKTSVFNSPLGYSPDERFFLYNEVMLRQGAYEGKIMAHSISSGNNSNVDIPYFQSASPLQTGYLSRDGRFLIMSLENQTGYGVEDLYVSIQSVDGRWSSPKNLGYDINTDKQEITPFLSADNKTLYFATNARGGFGSFDLYVSNRLDDSWRNWSEPRNLGSIINSEGSETSFIYNPDSEYAYFISTQNSDGYGDIKRIRIYPTNEGSPATADTSEVMATNPKAVYQKEIVFNVKDAKTDENLKFTYTGNIISISETKSLNAFGELVSELMIGLNEGDVIVLEFKSKGYLSESIKVNFNDLMSLENQYTIRLEPLETGRTITFKHVLFHQGKSEFIEGTIGELDLVVEMLEENPDVRIFLKGHTDNVGNKVLNIQLSQARVNAVRDFLIEKGIDKSRISGKGFGGINPIADNRKEETRKLNRRVEFEVIRD